jgi:hypothetical protein
MVYIEAFVYVEVHEICFGKSRLTYFIEIVKDLFLMIVIVNCTLVVLLYVVNCTTIDHSLTQLRDHKD